MSDEGYDGVDSPGITSILLHPDFRFGVHVVGAERDGERNWSLYGTKLCSGSSRHSVIYLDTWHYSSGFRQEVTLFRQDMNDLQGYDFAVAALPYSPFIMTNDPSLPGPGTYRGLEVFLLDTLAEAINFTYHYVAPKDNQWGRLTKNGTWTGMIGMVVYEEADWAVSDITFSPQREANVDFCQTFIYDASELVTPKAQPLPRWLSPVRPFTWEVWLAVVASMVLAGPFLWGLAKYCHGAHRPHVAWFLQFDNALLFILEPLFQRGTKYDIRETPGRVFVGCWLVFTMIVGISYSSSLTSFLIMPGLQSPIQDLRQLVTSDIGWAKVYFGGVQSALLEQAQDPVLIALREGVQWRDSLEGILKDVVKGTLATWDNSITTRLLVAVKYTDRNGQPLVHLPGFELLQERIAWPMQQYAPYKRSFDKYINRVVQAGIVEEWLQEIIFQEQSLLRKERMETSGVGDSVGGGSTEGGGQVILSLEHFQGPFYVLLLGFLAGALVLVLELGTYALLGGGGGLWRPGYKRS
ncbi:glutamate receptor ionotropic, delta-1-like [Homarus americanus]|uniref:glutamate receptor ionotropic, delta-1-like n=1 Tax=Homarus americanus TaxID=6706 RepID=UPI001C494096|nr:glutamate receptor ionotropic, delta-1-like [Homarus americanus]